MSKNMCIILCLSIGARILENHTDPDPFRDIFADTYPDWIRPILEDYYESWKIQIFSKFSTAKVT